MCSLGKTIVSIASFVVLTIFLYIFWEDIDPFIQNLFSAAAAFIVKLKDGIREQRTRGKSQISRD